MLIAFRFVCSNDQTRFEYIATEYAHCIYVYIKLWHLYVANDVLDSQILCSLYSAFFPIAITISKSFSILLIVLCRNAALLSVCVYVCFIVSEMLL